jgi:hypothetical protein
VGWYRDGDGRILALPPRGPFNAIVGEPALLLPQPDKDYAEYEFVQSLWHQFSVAIGQAERILVVGHSLNDLRLVQQLRNASPDKVGVTIRHGLPDDELHEAEQWVRAQLPGAHVIPMTFGPEPVIDPAAVDAFVEGKGNTFPGVRTDETLKYSAR